MNTLNLSIGFSMLRDDSGKWVIYLNNEQSEKQYAVYTSDIDTNIIMGAIKMDDTETKNRIALKYYTMMLENPALNVDIFYANGVSKQLMDKIEHVNIVKTAENPSRMLCIITVNGTRLEPREVSDSQWQRMWLANDMKQFKLRMATILFKDILSGESLPTNTMEEPNGKEIKVISPILKQFLDLKKKHPGALLLFRCGDFYETYKDDAEKASRILGITLTKSSKTKDDEGKPLAMAGFPYHALDTYLPKLIRAGQRVAICDQIEAPKK